MKRKELIKKYVNFFEKKDHKRIVNSPLIPENDSTTLFISAGMQPLVPYLLGKPHPLGKRLVNIQKCIRTRDIEEVGDETHHTFFEMFGNWSLGDYWKREAISYSYEFLTKILGISKENLSVTCFKGNKNAQKDTESEKIWEERGIKKDKIKFLEKDNWWGPVGKTGPCGPDTEMFIEDSEIGNNVFLEYEKDKDGNYKPIKQKSVDFGGGVERILAVVNQTKDHYETEVFKPIIKKIEELSKKTYEKNKKEMRIIADHIKASVFILNEKIKPSNKEQGYVLRRLIRRAIVYGKNLNLKNFTSLIAKPVFNIYEDYKFNEEYILYELKKEEEKFNKTLEKGLNLFNKLTKNKKELYGKQSFLLFQSYGFPIEMTLELAKENKINVSKEDFQKELKKHQKLSRTATAGKFKSGLSDHSEKTTRLHTAAHLLLAALQKVLENPNIRQKGSNINPERLRLDFNFDRKLTEEEAKNVEDIINEQVKKAIPIKRKEMSLKEAKKSGAQGIFDEKYGNKVSVYTIGNFSKEICTGPHIKNTKEIGKFKIKKQESCGAGVRRIKAIVE